MYQFKGIFLETAFERIYQAISDAIESAFGITLLDMLVQILATVILVIVVRFFLWDKVMAYLQRRREYVAGELESARQENENAQKLKEQTDREYAELKTKAKTIIETAKQKGEKEEQSIIDKAKAEARELRETTLKEIEAEKEKARLAMKDEVIEIAALMAEKIIDQEVDRNRYMDKAISDLDQKDDK